MKLYTKTGDDGTTGLFGGTRVAKHALRVAAYGDVDETNAAIGVARTQEADADVGTALQQVQNDLFSIGAVLATPPEHSSPQTVDGVRIAQLERWIDEAEAVLPQLTSFVLPGGTPSAAAYHVARAVCRRAERTVTQLDEQEAVVRPILVYLNRLSDLLFVWARLANHHAGCPDTPWLPRGDS